LAAESSSAVTSGQSCLAAFAHYRNPASAALRVTSDRVRVPEKTLRLAAAVVRQARTELRDDGQNVARLCIRRQRLRPAVASEVLLYSRKSMTRFGIHRSAVGPDVRNLPRAPECRDRKAAIRTVTASTTFIPTWTPPTPEAMKKARPGAIEASRKHRYIEHLRREHHDQFRQDLECGLGRPVIDETGLEGVYDMEVQGTAKNTDEFIRILRDQTGLVLTPASRSIEVFTLRSLN
jgi:hypothetical protein